MARRWVLSLRNSVNFETGRKFRQSAREQFIRCMEAWGYGVKWAEGHKHITYTTPENMRCRDSKLLDQTLLQENMEHYFAMGGISPSASITATRIFFKRWTA